MANETSARVSDGKTQEEQDQLDRSKKKAKIDVSSQDTVVMETQRMDVQKQNNDIISQRPKVSYRDICMNFNGGSNQDTSPEEDWWFMNKDISNEEDEMEEEEKVHEEVTEESLFVPVAKVSKEDIKAACIPWKRSLVVKLLGKRVGLQFLKTRLTKMWEPSGGMEIIDLENDYFLIRFEEWPDVVRAFEGGPWMILGHILVVQRWHPEFFPREDELKRVAVWIRVPGLPIEYYDKNILWKIGNCIGKTVKIDSNTLRSKNESNSGLYAPERGKFARICVEIDLRKILRSKFVLNKRTYTVEYEGINLVCFTCGRYGHRKDQCEITNGETPQGPTNENLEKNFEKQKEQDNNTNEKFGPWMLVQRGGRRRKQQPRQSSTGEKSGKEMVGPSNNHGSRFGALLIDEGVKDNNGDELIGERQMESDKIDQVKHLAKETQATETHSKVQHKPKQKKTLDQT
ncbi:hypothetical protein L195_g021514 [Trifolium pratense]|uniref:CCHC-type domain-containing protein n=1 Tax=Trifolium pratense TaxID=57577 RepID=A0A2K3N5G5_TRIPR|nr:hypothetical protein L195_g021514 [Trifolium pratense]